MRMGDVYGSILYGVGRMPLAEKMRAAILQALQLWFADDSSGTGEAVHVAAVFKFLQLHGPRYGYFPSTANLFFICKGEDEPIIPRAA